MNTDSQTEEGMWHEVVALRFVEKGTVEVYVNTLYNGVLLSTIGCEARLNDPFPGLLEILAFMAAHNARAIINAAKSNDR